MTRHTDRRLRSAQLLSLVTTFGLLLLFCASGRPALGVALLLSALASLGLTLRRTFGLFALLAVAAALPFSGISGSSMVALMAVALGTVVAQLDWLLRADRLAAALLALAASGFGVSFGYLAYAAEAPRPHPWAAYVEPPPSPDLRPPPAPQWRGSRLLQLTARQLPGKRALEVTFTNRDTRPLSFDLPLPGINYAPLLSPLLRVVAENAYGKPLVHIRRFGCGTVYSYRKVSRVVLAPGASVSRRVELPYRHYAPATVLQAYDSHGMLMNARALIGQPQSPAPQRRFTVRVVYDSAAIAGSWRSDLHTGRDVSDVRVHGESAKLTYVDPEVRPGEPPPRLVSRAALDFWRALSAEKRGH